MNSSYLKQSQSGLLFLSQQHLTLQCRSTVCWRNRPGQKQPWLRGPSEPGNSDGADVCNKGKQNLVTQEGQKAVGLLSWIQRREIKPKPPLKAKADECKPRCEAAADGSQVLGDPTQSEGTPSSLQGHPPVEAKHQLLSQDSNWETTVSSSNSSGRRPPTPLPPTLADKRAVMAPLSSHSLWAGPVSEDSKLIPVTENLI